MACITRLIYSPRFLDPVFGFVGLAMAAGLLFGMVRRAPTAPVLEHPLLFGTALVVAVVLLALLGGLVSRLDQRYADDYMFQVLYQSGTIAALTAVAASAAYDIVLVPWFGAPENLTLMQVVIPVVFLSWSIGYFFLRLRGTGK